MVVIYTRPIAGRERLALELGVEIDEYYRKAAAAGRCTEPETFILPSGKSIWFIKGEAATLRELSQTAESLRFLAACDLLLEEFGFEIALAGSASTEFIERFGTVAHEYGYA